MSSGTLDACQQLVSALDKLPVTTFVRFAILCVVWCFFALNLRSFFIEVLCEDCKTTSYTCLRAVPCVVRGLWRSCENTGHCDLRIWTVEPNRAHSFLLCIAEKHFQSCRWTINRVAQSVSTFLLCASETALLSRSCIAAPNTTLHQVTDHIHYVRFSHYQPFFRNTTHRTRAPCVSTVADAFCTCVDRCLMRSAHFLRFSDVPSTVFLQSSYRRLRHKNSLTHAASDASSSEETLNSNRGSLSCFSLHLYSSGYFGQRPCWRRIADSSSRGASSKLEFFVPTRLSRPVAIATWDPEVWTAMHRCCKMRFNLRTFSLARVEVGCFHGANFTCTHEGVYEVTWSACLQKRVAKCYVHD